ncbi:MAG: GtrA family protein [Hyphomicrobiaceae bacterium]
MTLALDTLLAPLDAVLRVVPERLRPLARQIVGYLAVSGTALVVDVAVYWALLKVLHLAALAAAGGYVCGVMVHYALSSRVVFAGRLRARGVVAEAPVLAKFFVAGGTGLLVTVATVGLLADVMGMNALFAKLVAAGLSFVTVFTALRVFVFNAPSPERA